jgi:hypothetical protein
MCWLIIVRKASRKKPGRVRVCVVGEEEAEGVTSPNPRVLQALQAANQWEAALKAR